VVTFVGPPEPVLEAAVRAARKALEVIDMHKHKGAHPRFGAIDVCPLVPIANITMDETVEWAHKFGRRLGDELGLTGYFYEYAATTPQRRNLADVRSGEYEGLAQKLARPEGPRISAPHSSIPAAALSPSGRAISSSRTT